MSAPADDALGMLRAGVLVAAIAVPLAAGCVVLSRMLRVGMRPAWQVPPFVWNGGIIFALFACFYLGVGYLQIVLDAGGFFQTAYPNGFPVPSVPEQQTRTDSQLKAMWAGLLIVPPLLLAAALLPQLVFDRNPRLAGELRRVPRAVVLGIVGWLTVGWMTYALNLLVQTVAQASGAAVEEHPLVLLGWRGDGYDGVVFALSACVTAPLVEEFLFRGLLVPWAGGRWYRPWVLVFAACGLAAMGGEHRTEAVAFVGLLGMTQYGIQRYGKRVWRKLPKRTTLAVWSSAALFAAAHSVVWPSPVALFVLGLGLGYLTARTRSWAASAVCHILFNTTSFVYLVSRG